MKRLLLGALLALGLTARPASAGFFGGGGATGDNATIGGAGTAASPLFVKGSSVAILNSAGFIPASLIATTPGVSYDATLAALILGAGTDLTTSSGVVQASYTFNNGSEITILRIGRGTNQLAAADLDITGITNDLYGVATGGRIGFGPILTMHGISINAVGQEAVFKMYVSSGTSEINGTTKVNQCGLFALGEQVAGVDKGHTAAIGLCANQNATASALGTYVSIQTTPNNTITPVTQMIITNNGQVGIQTTAPGGGFGLDVASGVSVRNGLVVGGTTTLNGSLGIAVGSGISSPPGASTMSPCGFFQYTDSTTITGSTYTTNAAISIFSTATLAANFFNGVGEVLVVDCIYQNTATPTTPTENLHIDNAAAAYTQIVSGNTTANDELTLHTELLFRRPNTIYPYQVGGWHVNGNTNAGALGSGVAMASGAATVNAGFNNAVTHTINCSASSAAGGVVNFIGMRVGKKCM